jgi:hypothetical protein
MATDITLAKLDQPIKNGTMVVTCGRTGFPAEGTIVYDRYVKNTPSLATIESKFNNRFDDPSYYYGIGNNSIIGS